MGWVSRIFLLPLLSCFGQLPEAPEPLLQQPYDVLWTSGLQNYQLGIWGEATRLLERSLLGRSALRRLRSRCSERCSRVPPLSWDSPAQDPSPPLADPLSQLAFFGRLLHRAACLRHCLGSVLGDVSRHRVGEEVEAAFRLRHPYNYLQLCYYKTGQLQKAASAAQTFLEAHPDHKEMLENMDMYRLMDGVKSEDFQDLEPQLHWDTYEAGVRLYDLQQHEGSIFQLEQSVGHYLSSLSECRDQCLGPFQFEDYSYLAYQSHLHEAIGDHLVQVLHCNQECIRDLGSRPRLPRRPPDFLPSVFTLLLSAYHQVGDYERAVECSRTCLLFWPNDQAVLGDLEYFQSRLGEERSEQVRAREEIRLHLERSLLEKRLLYLAMDGIGEEFQDPESWTPVDIVPVSLREKLRRQDNERQASVSENKTSRREAKPLRGLEALRAASPHLASLAVTEVGTPETGPEHYVLDRALSHRECRLLRGLSNAVDRLTPGKSNKDARLLGGISLLKVMELARDGLVEKEATRLFHEVTERGRTIVDHLYKPDGSLHLGLSHLRCQLASAGNRREVPSPTWDPETSRDGNRCGAGVFSVHLYLNDEFEGGRSILTDLETGAVMYVTPTCGRVLSYRCWNGTYVKVGEVTGGQRCALTLWFTLDSIPSEENAQIEALRTHLFPEPYPDTSPGRVDLRGGSEQMEGGWGRQGRDGGRRREVKKDRAERAESPRDEL
ncbi:prolyl 3-hydroxylase 1-like isoform X2 [Narcine bancroftii]|uniref:prolyl 3-hydroxylase 1-like isoform X2 n=1 Tax=Narcine bancroftii TaxID=1343680 RepID=UPI003831086C